MCSAYSEAGSVPYMLHVLLSSHNCSVDSQHMGDIEAATHNSVEVTPPVSCILESEAAASSQTQTAGLGGT